ncbi:MAG: response regulator transcription factor [Flavobacteriales bacterium]|jgi:two-component system, OmpR family, alkaline phosphatase synthesis response regulator PhoP|nr:response regulator transcription factor [Flavobacteriales bacterium]MBT3962878.1 response regulator transcription factor [Flavobacteriales bacterium]MBT4704706.1 response regulator transcription factor [Flavobacteriales bacterium]MBT4931711.1 response regulator transcription factor [Flavobacteriales bacterium]MBT5133677.1 response regulator transcription factor [Flavobacteriales bacterium]
MSKRILLVEDEERLLEVVKLNLELEGYDVVPAMNGKEAMDRFHEGPFDLILLDVMLPHMDGFSVCRSIRLENRKVPILFLTAKNSAQDRVMGLKIGGDDYLVKPFDLEELLLRILRLIERTGSEAKVGLSEYKFNGNTLFFDRNEAISYSGDKITLTKKELQILRLLVERDGETISREEMLDLIWGVDVYPSTRTIDNFIVGFRKHFEKDPKKPLHFHSIRGVGYRFLSNPVV